MDKVNANKIEQAILDIERDIRFIKRTTKELEFLKKVKKSLTQEFNKYKLERLITTGK